MIKELRQEITESLLKIASSSTGHGISKIISKDSKFRFVWLVFWLISAGFAIWFFITTLGEYFQYKVLTKVDNVKQTPFYFPSVTICDMNILNYIQNTSREEIIGHISNSGQDFKTYTEAAKMYSIKVLNFFWEKKIKTVSDELYNSFIVSCLFNQVPCGINDFLISFHSFYGMCFTFNEPKNTTENFVPREVSRAGRSYGLIVELYLGDPEIESFNINNCRTSGVLMQIHEQNRTISYYEANEVAPSVKTSIGVKKVIEKKMSEPFSNCLNLNTEDSYDSDLYRQVFQQNSHYSEK